ncbi:MAG: PEP/pyruvate-binding domain-containing protein [Planctomycetota bacterium]|jgi:pyruvate,water dikinase|nr:PEP/pyruvate-binding domain-containing protein [Planctomycetota bacterium]
MIQPPPHENPTCVSLDRALSAQAVGGKAASLTSLRIGGIPIPNGFVVTNSIFHEYRDVTDLSPATRTAILDALESLLQDIGPQRLIARSSAVGEDGEEASFAGQLDSFTCDPDPESVLQAIQRCWNSYDNGRVHGYQNHLGIELQGMGVVVQHHIEATVSGVLFSRNPLTQPTPSSPVFVEYVYGGAENLVSGRVDPGSFLINRETGACEPLASPKQVSPESETDLDLLAHQLLPIAKQIEEILGSEVDVEWTATADGSIQVVQARPITTPIPNDPGEGPIYIWSNANISENYPEPVRPFLYSVAVRGYRHYFTNIGRAFGISKRRIEQMAEPLASIVGSHGGYLYYNLTNIYRCLRLAPLGNRIESLWNGFIGVEEEAATAVDRDQDPTPNRLLDSLALLWMFLRGSASLLSIPWAVWRWERRVDRYVASCETSLGRPRNLDDRLSELHGFWTLRGPHWRDAALSDAASMFSIGCLESLLTRWKNHLPGDLNHHDLLRGLPGLVSTRPTQLLWEMGRLIERTTELNKLFSNDSPEHVLDQTLYGDSFPDFRQRLEMYLQNWGFRCSGELLLTRQDYRDDPRLIVPILASYAASITPSPETIAVRQAQESKNLLSSFRPRLSRWRWWILRIVVALTRSSIRFRERARMKQSKLYASLKRTLRETGELLHEQGRLERAQDIHFLQSEEIEAYLGGRDPFPELLPTTARNRRKQFASLSGQRPPDTLRAPRRGTWKPIPTSPRPPLPEYTENGEDSGSLEIQGKAASLGVAEGPAIVLAGLQELSQIATGQILVTGQTDPGWAPIFPLIGGIVLEKGGILSHGAIVAREFGIPAVVQAERATTILESGQPIVVDGNRGVVHYRV